MQATALPIYADQLDHAYKWLKVETAHNDVSLFRDKSNKNWCAINGKLVGKNCDSFRIDFSGPMGSPTVYVFLSGVCKFQGHAFNKWEAILLQAVLRPDKNEKEFNPSSSSASKITEKKKVVSPKVVEKKKPISSEDVKKKKAVPSFIGDWKLATPEPKSKKPTEKSNNKKKGPDAATLLQKRAFANKDLSKPISFVPALQEIDAQAAKVVESPKEEEPTAEYSPIAMRMMEKMGYKIGSGLGKAENGIRQPIVAKPCARSIGSSPASPPVGPTA